MCLDAHRWQHNLFVTSCITHRLGDCLWFVFAEHVHQEHKEHDDGHDYVDEEIPITSGAYRDGGQVGCHGLEDVSFQGHEVSFLKFVVWFDMADNFVYCLLIGKSMFYLNSIQSKETIKLKTTICKARRTKLTTTKIEKKATMKLCIAHMIMTHNMMVTS